MRAAIRRGRFEGRLTVRFTAIGVIAGALLWGTAAQATEPLQLYDSEQPGSVLVFPKFLRGNTFVDGLAVPSSTFYVGVRCPYGATCVTDQPVFIHFQWIGFGDSHNICASNNFTIKTSVNDKLVFGANGKVDADSGGALIPMPPTLLGYLIGWVVDINDRPIKFDGLFGEGVVRESPTMANGYPAVAIQAINELATGAFVPTIPGLGGLPQLQFDGRTGYKAVTGEFSVDVRFDNHTLDQVIGDVTNNFLIVLTLDVASGFPNPTTAVGLDFFNQKQVGLSDTLEFVCWMEIPIVDIDADLTVQNFGTKNGIVTTSPAFQLPSGKPASLLGLFQVTEGTDNVNSFFVRGWFNTPIHGPNGVPTLFETDEP